MKHVTHHVVLALILSGWLAGSAGAVIFSDDFTGKTVGQVPSGWTCNNSSFQVQSDSGNLILKNMGTDSHVWPTDSVNTPANWANFEMTIRIRDQGNLDFRNAAGANYLRFEFTTGGVTLWDMPSWTSRGSRAALTAATWYRLRLRCSGTSVKARFWLDGSGEPGTWDIDTTVTAVTGGKMDFNYQANISLDDVVVNAIDTTAPATTSNLATSSPTSTSITLTWTAPGDDGTTGTATTYDVRYRTGGAVVTTNWTAATQATGEPTPHSAGTGESFVVGSLSSSTVYYFGLETADEVPNWSAISNSPSGTTSAPPDTTPPATTSNLATSSPTGTSITLTWTAPGDDGTTGTATTYDVRYRTGGAVVTTNWTAATQATGEPTPHSAGTGESFVVSGLTGSTTYYFGLKTGDEVPNWSAISNSPSGTTTDVTPPATTSNLATSSPTGTSITLTWTAPGDDGTTGTATTYNVRYRTGGAVVTTNWAAASQATGEPTPHSAGTGESFVVSGLTSGTTYYFGLETADEVPNWSAISNSPSGSTTDVTPPATTSNLAAGTPTSTSLTLTWTAPGDDGTTGTATTYDVRYRTGGAVVTTNWTAATQATGEPTPHSAGTGETFVVGSLSSSTVYYFGLETADEVPN